MNRFKGLLAIVTALALLTVFHPTVGSAEPQDGGVQKVGDWRKGYPSAYACGPNVMYLGTGMLLQTWDISDMANPIMTSEIEYPDLIDDLEVDGDWLVGVARGMFVTSDLSDPLHPVIASQNEFAGSDSYKMCLGDGMAYVTSSGGELNIFDLADPAAPVAAGSGSAWGDVDSIVYENGKVYLGFGGGGSIFVFDVSDPNTPDGPMEYSVEYPFVPDGILVRDGILHVFAGNAGWFAYGFDLFDLISLGQMSSSSTRVHYYKNEVLLVVEDGIYNFYTFGASSTDLIFMESHDPGLERTVFDLSSDMQHIVARVTGGVTNIYDISTASQFEFALPGRTDMTGLCGTLYVAGQHSSSRLSFYDIDNPSSIDFLGTMTLPGVVEDLNVAEGYAVASCRNYGAVVVDLGSGYPFAVRDTVIVTGDARATGFHERLLYVSSSDNSVTSYDLSLPGSPVAVGTVTAVGPAVDLEFVDEFMLLASNNTIQCFDLSDPNLPVMVGTMVYPTSSLKQVTVAAGVVYVAGVNTGIGVLQLSPTGELTPLTTFDPPEYVYGLRSRGTRLYAAIGTGGTAVYDVTDPWDIQTIHQETTLRFGLGVDMWERVFVIANGEYGFTVFNDDQATPVHLSTLEAVRIPGGASLSWRVLSAGIASDFHVWRGDSEAQRMRRTSTALSGADRYSWVDQAPPARATLYWLEETFVDGAVAWYGPADLAEMSLPVRAVLQEPWPNPFNPRTTIAFVLEHQGRAELTVYDLAGRRVTVLVDEVLTSGRHTADWNGSDMAGRSVAAGQYLMRLRTDEGIDVRKVVLAK